MALASLPLLSRLISLFSPLSSHFCFVFLLFLVLSRIFFLVLSFFPVSSFFPFSCPFFPSLVCFCSCSCPLLFFVLSLAVFLSCPLSVSSPWSVFCPVLCLYLFCLLSTFCPVPCLLFALHLSAFCPVPYMFFVLSLVCFLSCSCLFSVLSLVFLYCPLCVYCLSLSDTALLYYSRLSIVFLVHKYYYLPVPVLSCPSLPHVSLSTCRLYVTLVTCPFLFVCLSAS